MIEIGRVPATAASLEGDFPPNSLERRILAKMEESSHRYRFPSRQQLKFELDLRREIVEAARALNKSGLAFAVFRESRCNQEYWDRKPDGGFALKAGVNPADAVRDIFRNGSAYATECATAMVIVYYGALAELFPDEAFNRIFRNIYLMNWSRIEAELAQVGQMMRVADHLPGDRLYFRNPDVDPENPQWQGENVIDLGDGRFYGHGIGIQTADNIIRILNSTRREGADTEAYLMEEAGRPDFQRLGRLYQRYAPQVPRSATA